MGIQEQHQIIDKDQVQSNLVQKEKTFFLRPGLELIISDFHVPEPTRINFESHENVCELCFILTGKIKSWIYGFKEPVQVKPYSTALWLTPGLDSYTDYKPCDKVAYVCIKIDRPMLIDIAGDFLNNASKDFNLILHNKQESLYYETAPMTIPMQAAIQQIYQCPYHGDMARIFLEGKVLELISHLLTCHFGDVQKKASPLPSWEKSKIKIARDILIENSENPPSLTQLAKKTGMNVTKLKCGFKIVYGTSVFEYLRNYRLSKACYLLENDNLSVTEIAYLVGYSSPAHFSRIFTKYYGVNPKDYLLGFRCFR